MTTTSVQPEQKEACLCIGFGSTLTGSALAWLKNLPNKSVKNFPDLVNQFTRQFACSRGLKMQSSTYDFEVRGDAQRLPESFHRRDGGHPWILGGHNY